MTPSNRMQQRVVALQTGHHSSSFMCAAAGRKVGRKVIKMQLTTARARKTSGPLLVRLPPARQCPRSRPRVPICENAAGVALAVSPLCFLRLLLSSFDLESVSDGLRNPAAVKTIVRDVNTVQVALSPPPRCTTRSFPRHACCEEKSVAM